MHLTKSSSEKKILTGLDILSIVSANHNAKELDYWKVININKFCDVSKYMEVKICKGSARVKR